MIAHCAPRGRLRSPLLFLGLAVVAVGLLAGCSSGTKVTRIDTESTIDLSGRWNDADSRMVAEEMISDSLNRPWLARFEGANPGKRPTVIVGTVKNRSAEHIATEVFTKDIEQAYVNSGQVRVVASQDERGEIRDEREDQQDFSDPATVKKFGKEHGADYMLMGTVNSVEDQKGGEQVVFYQTNLELTDIQTNEKVWIGDKEIKKYIGRAKVKP
jgi:uncharacterized protein (TIGR02722 family)